MHSIATEMFCRRYSDWAAAVAMTKLPTVTPELPLEFRECVAERMVEIGSRYFQHGDELAKIGFNAFIPFLEHELSACEGDDRDFHRLFLVEEAKEILGNWGPMPMVLHGASVLGYCSPLIESLRARRREAGYDREFFQTSGADAWKYYLSPCRIERERIFRTDSVRSRQLGELTNRSFENARRLEVAKFSLEPDPGISVDSAMGYKELFQRERARLKAARQACLNIVETELHLLGFKRSAKLSSGSIVVFVLVIDTDWHLRFMLEFSDVTVQPYLRFCHSSLSRRPLWGKGPPHDPRTCIEIRFDYSAPFFHAAYSFYRTQSELEVDVRAILALYRLEHECVLEILESNLGSL